MKQSGGWLALLDRHLQCRDAESLAAIVAHGPTHDAPRIQIQDHRQMQPSRAGRDDGRIASPDAVGLRNSELPGKRVIY